MPKRGARAEYRFYVPPDVGGDLVAVADICGLTQQGALTCILRGLKEKGQLERFAVLGMERSRRQGLIVKRKPLERTWKRIPDPDQARAGIYESGPWHLRFIGNGAAKPATRLPHEGWWLFGQDVAEQMGATKREAQERAEEYIRTHTINEREPT